MKEFNVWVRLDTTRTINTIVHADNVLNAQLIAEAQYGKEKILSVIPYHEGQCFPGIPPRSSRGW